MERKLIILLFLVTAITLNGQERIYLDVDGNEINKEEFLKKYLGNNSLFSRWDSIVGTKRFSKLRRDLYAKGRLNYKEIKNHLEKLTGQNFKDTLNILIAYSYKDDLCVSNGNNHWRRFQITDRKSFIHPQLKTIKKYNSKLICLFEQGITLKNRPNNKKEYFFLDKHNFFRNKIFKRAALCGSFAIIRPNGEVLVRNGEYRTDWMIRHLKPENWSKFFSPSN